MKTFKNKRLKATLLAIAAVLTFGLTSCTDEIGSDVTTGEPGYLTLNLKTLQPKQTKLLTGNADDFKKITNLNIFVFNSTGELLLNKYYTSTDITLNSTGDPISIPIQVSTLPDDAFVVAVANYGSRIDDIINYAALEAKVIPTIKDFSTTGLHMTGRGDITKDATGYVYTATVKIAPVEAKITVKWEFEALSDADNYDVTGIYVVNAISQTTMPIILNTTTAPATENINPTATTNNISLVPGTPATRTALTGLAVTAPRDFNFYTMDANTGLLSNETALDVSTGVLPGTASDMTGSFHYYVGENYNTDVVPSTPGAGEIRTSNAAQNENTLVVVRVTPKNDAPAYITAMGHKYYTYAFTKNSTAINNSNLGSASTGFSVRRKNNYQLTFNLSEMGADEPFTRMSTLTVNVQAQDWDDVTPTGTSF